MNPMKNCSIVFMGTPEFAVAILKHLHTNGIDIRAVITAPDKPSGRGQKMHQSAVKHYALENGLNILQPTNLKDPAFLSDLEALHADLFVVVAFRMLPQAVWSMPSKGTINLHASLLPNYRGAAPINWAIINGEHETGVTSFFIEQEIDTGKIIEQSKVTIEENETVGTLYERLMKLGAEVMLSTVHKIANEDVGGIDQNQLITDSIKAAPKIFKGDCEMDFSKNVSSLHNFCRGLSPYPAAWCTLYNTERNESKTYKIFHTLKTDLPVNNDKQIKSDSEGLLFPTSDFYLRVLEIQPEGKRKMLWKEFLAGNSIEHLVTKGI